MGVWCGSGRLGLYRIVARGNQCRFFLVIWGKFVSEEVVTQGESVAVPVKRLRVAGPFSQMRASVDALERVSGGREFFA